MKIYNIYAVRLNCNPANEPEPTGLSVKAFSKKEALNSAQITMHNAGYSYSYRTKGVFVIEEPQVSGFSYQDIKNMTEDQLRENAFHLLISDARGIYIPRDFINQFRGWRGYGKGKFNSYRSILSNPENELYWDAWNELLDKLTYTTEKGIEHSLYQDGDLFAVDLNLIKAWEEVTKSEFEW